MPSDIAISTANLPTSNAPVRNKPTYLITLVDTKHTTKSVSEVKTFFVAMDRPGFENNFVAVKGVYCEQSEDDIIKGFSEILNKAPKETVLEVMLPVHRVHSIRSLVFNAVKPTVMPNR